MIVGSKEIFAIEYELLDRKLGYIQLWIDWMPIGLREETYVFPIVSSLERVKDFSSEETMNTYNYSADTIYSTIMQNENKFSGTLLGFGESFDCFEIRMYIFGDAIVAIWKLIKTINDENISIQYAPNLIYSAKIDNRFYFDTIRMFKMNLSREF